MAFRPILASVGRMSSIESRPAMRGLSEGAALGVGEEMRLREVVSQRVARAKEKKKRGQQVGAPSSTYRQKLIST